MGIYLKAIAATYFIKKNNNRKLLSKQMAFKKNGGTGVMKCLLKGFPIEGEFRGIPSDLYLSRQRRQTK
jgi:hypothetical protein